MPDEAPNTPSQLDLLRLRRYRLFADLDLEHLRPVQRAAELRAIPADRLLLRLGDLGPKSYFLVDGMVELESPDGRRIRIDGASESARSPLADLRPRRYTVRSLTPVRYFTLDTAVLQALAPVPRGPQGGEDEAEQDDVAALWNRIRDDLERDSLVLPSLPDVALRVSRAIADERNDSSRVAAVIQADPAITAKIVKVANSPLYGGRAHIASCRDAVIRIGLRATGSLVTSFALREVFQAREKPVQQRMEALWQHSVRVAALCYVLAGITGRFPAERVLLAGLVHDIGLLPLLARVDRAPALAQAGQRFDALLEEFRPALGARILTAWGFAADLVDVALHAEDWLHDGGTEPSYADLVIVAQLHALIGIGTGSGAAAGMPPLDQVPALRKLFPDSLSPRDSLKVLRRAEDKVALIEGALRAR